MPQKEIKLNARLDSQSSQSSNSPSNGRVIDVPDGKISYIDCRTSIEAFKCPGCDKLIDVKSINYFTLKGNIYLGDTIAIFKNKDDNVIIRLCRKCLFRILENSSNTTKNNPESIDPEIKQMLTGIEDDAFSAFEADPEKVPF
jgi:hypothetical protein